jgi:hypothetical protein
LENNQSVILGELGVSAAGLGLRLVIRGQLGVSAAGLGLGFSFFILQSSFVNHLTPMRALS